MGGIGFFILAIILEAEALARINDVPSEVYFSKRTENCANSKLRKKVITRCAKLNRANLRLTLMQLRSQNRV